MVCQLMDDRDHGARSASFLDEDKKRQRSESVLVNVESAIYVAYLILT
jgi:hypothetical protein